MCRMIVFAGNCTRCGRYYTWPSLDQSISCLEAKNNGVFGDCSKQVHMDERQANLECASCSTLSMVDEGISLVDDHQHTRKHDSNKRRRVR